jgi:NAD(P)-dependent dehydrogenase (short-subunit alcohol dehydrogenase family)
MKRILVLGGTGFVGRHLCKELVRLQHRVTVPTRNASKAGCYILPFLNMVQASIRGCGASGAGSRCGSDRHSPRNSFEFNASMWSW